MEYLENFRKVVVLGAAGKMGSGILLLTAMEMTDLRLQKDDSEMDLIAMDVSTEGLKGLIKYVEAQVRRAAEKKVIMLRTLYESREDLIENGEIIEAYVSDVVGMIRTSTHLEDAFGASLVFEAIKEDPKLKVSILGEIASKGNGKAWFLTNTSSIPIGELDAEAGLNGNVLGFHFYNPPAVQRLVELIKADNTKPELVEFAKMYAKKLRKVLVPSSDFAGFVGNGHFMRDALFGIKEVERLSTDYKLYEGIYLFNNLTQFWLVRPMGIFQLIDYVGVDVVSYIMKVMNPYLSNEDLHSDLLDKYLEAGVKGGQYADGSQKDGILKYERGRAVGVYDLESGGYINIDIFQSKIDTQLGDLPQKIKWKDVNFSPKKSEILDEYFSKLAKSKSLGAELALAYGQESKRIAELLVNSGVAVSNNDVNKVLETGFYHAYGPVNEYFNS